MATPANTQAMHRIKRMACVCFRPNWCWVAQILSLSSDLIQANKSFYSQPTCPSKANYILLQQLANEAIHKLNTFQTGELTNLITHELTN